MHILICWRPLLYLHISRLYCGMCLMSDTPCIYYGYTNFDFPGCGDRLQEVDICVHIVIRCAHVTLKEFRSIPNYFSYVVSSCFFCLIDSDSTYYNFKTHILKKIAMNLIREGLDVENAYVREFLHIWKTRSKTTPK